MHFFANFWFNSLVVPNALQLTGCGEKVSSLNMRPMVFFCRNWIELENFWLQSGLKWRNLALLGFEMKKFFSCRDRSKSRLLITTNSVKRCFRINEITWITFTGSCSFKLSLKHLNRIQNLSECSSIVYHMIISPRRRNHSLSKSVIQKTALAHFWKKHD